MNNRRLVSYAGKVFHERDRHSFHGRRPNRRARPGQQVTRITALLEELEGMTCAAGHVPPALLARAHAAVGEERAWLRLAPGEPDPQPEVDREAVERMYRSLKPER
jgi:hypothetical protein